MRTGSGFRVIVPSRIKGALPRFDAGELLRQDLARAMLLDTVDAAVAARGVSEVVVVSGDPLVADALARRTVAVIPGEGRGGVARLLESARAEVEARATARATAVLMGDLPSLTPAELATALCRAGPEQLVMRDLADDHANLLLSTRGWPELSLLSPPPRQQPGGPLVRPEPIDFPGVHADVDTVSGLWIAGYLGLGTATSALTRRPEVVRLLEHSHVLAS